MGRPPAEVLLHGYWLHSTELPHVIIIQGEAFFALTSRRTQRYLWCTSGSDGGRVIRGAQRGGRLHAGMFVRTAATGMPANAYDLIVRDAASQVTGFCRKYDSFAMWHVIATLFPNTASSVTGFRDFTA